MYTFIRMFSWFYVNSCIYISHTNDMNEIDKIPGKLMSTIFRVSLEFFFFEVLCISQNGNNLASYSLLCLK